MNKKRICIGIFFLILSEFVLWYLLSPALSIFDPRLYVCFLIPLAIFLFDSFGFTKPVTIPILIVLILILIISLTHLNLNGRSSQIHSDIAKFDNDGIFPDTSLLLEINSSSDLPVIDKEDARILSENLLKSKADYAENYTVNPQSNLIFYQESYYFISPLKCISSVDFAEIPAYILVNMHTGKATFVELENNIKYTPTSAFNKNLLRHIRKNYPFDIFGNENFEIDENGHPYYIVPILGTRSLIYGGKYVKKVLIVDAVNGNIHEYAFSELPAWVDNVYDVERIMNEAFWYITYNAPKISSMSVDSKLVTRYHNNNEYYEFGKDGAIYVYTGVTLYSYPTNNIGFLVSNLRTGETTYCSDFNIGETALQTSAQTLCFGSQYFPSHTLLVNIEGSPVYYLTLKNPINRIEQYVLANQKYSKTFFVSGQTIDETLRNYYKLIDKPYPSIEHETND